MIASLIICASLTVVDGDTVKCEGQNMRLLGEGIPFISGIEAPSRFFHSYAILNRSQAYKTSNRASIFFS